MTDKATAARLRRYVREYSRAAWPGLTVPRVTADDVFMIELRSDGYASAHVDGEHTAHGICRYRTARECGERSAAAEYVECN